MLTLMYVLGIFTGVWGAYYAARFKTWVHRVTKPRTRRVVRRRAR